LKPSVLRRRTYKPGPRRCVRRGAADLGIDGHSVVGRYYDPTTGQFISVDPDVAGTGEPYAFVQDDPVNGSDSNGLFISGPNGQACFIGRGCNYLSQDAVNNAHAPVYGPPAPRPSVPAPAAPGEATRVVAAGDKDSATITIGGGGSGVSVGVIDALPLPDTTFKACPINTTGHNTGCISATLTFNQGFEGTFPLSDSSGIQLIGSGPHPEEIPIYTFQLTATVDSIPEAVGEGLGADSDTPDPSYFLAVSWNVQYLSGG
jgi:RHS repeat-associated protein